MKKFLVILMVLAMASFLFVGCVPTTPAAEEEAAEEEAAEVVKTETPYIVWIDDGAGASIDLSPTATQYSSDPLVKGVGVPGAVIKVYIGGVQSGVGMTDAGGTFDGAGGVGIAVSMITLTEGVCKLYVTAKQPGLAESDKSAEYTFTYDETAPKIVSAIGDSTDQTITVTFDEAVDKTTAETVGNYELDGVGFAGTTVVTKVSAKVVKITTPDIAVPTYGGTFILGCALIEDTISNAMSALFTETCLGIVTGK